MSRLLSDRAEKTDQVVVLPVSLEDPSKSPPGLYRVGLVAILDLDLCFLLLARPGLLLALSQPPFWDPIPLPETLWTSTALILASSVTFEIARRQFRKGQWRAASRFLMATACLGAGFLASQITAWRELVKQGAFLAQNPAQLVLLSVHRIARRPSGRRTGRIVRRAARKIETPRIGRRRPRTTGTSSACCGSHCLSCCERGNLSAITL